MRAIKRCKKSRELLLFELLKDRKELTTRENHFYDNLKKGYEGEMQFSKLIEQSEGYGLVLYDLLFESKQTTFQIDSLIVTPSKIYLFEVKNYNGEYYFEGEKFYKKPRFEVVNPLHQLSRTESLLRQLLLSIGSNKTISSFLVFIHPSFTLYQAPMDKPIIFPNQIKKYLDSIGNENQRLSENDKRLVKKLISLSNDNSRYQQLPNFEYQDLNKGITCANCRRLSVHIVKRKCICDACGHQENVTGAVLRAVDEFKILFPDKRITTVQIHDWCQIVGFRTIRRILSQHYKAVGTGRWTYYIDSNKA